MQYTPLFPTPVGVFPSQYCPFRTLPHSSPRPWGCFRVSSGSFRACCLFPTPVGVFPPLLRLFRTDAPLPHARGGVSVSSFQCLGEFCSSPRPWGCFSRLPESTPSLRLFPTPVGVFPDCSDEAVRFPPLPHARGGVSTRAMRSISASPSSPRPWGCFFLC